MRIACISASRVPSLAANSIQVMKACQAMSQLGHDVHLFVPRHSRQTDKMELSAFYGLTTLFKISWLPSRQSLHRYDFSFQAVRQASQLKADVAYIWPVQAGIFSLLARLPVIIELHGPPEGRFGPTLFNIFRRIPGKKRILTITQALANQIYERFKIKMHHMRVCPNGVDLEQYANLPDPPAARASLGLPPILTIGYTGHLYHGRGMNMLIELAKCFPRISFIWVGGNPADVVKWQERLNAERVENIILTGFIQNSQLPLYQAASDILLMPYEKLIAGSSGGDSSSYASPMKMFEYMASKRAIISSDLPVIREVLNSSNAILCSPEDIDIWSQAIGSLITDVDRRLALAQQAWRDIQRYTWVERARNALAGFGQ